MSSIVDYAPAPPPAPVSTKQEVTAAWRRALLSLVALELVVLYAPTVQWLFGRWTMSVWHNAHGLFVPPLVAWLVHRELRRRPELPTTASPWGFALLVPALILHALDAGMHTQLLSAFSLVLALPGFALLFLGLARTKAIAFPLAFSLFALPIPLGLTETLHLVLRYVAAQASAELLPVIGVPLYLEGTTLHTTAGALQIADACSGFSTLYAAMAVACLAAYSAHSTARRVVVLLAAAPIAIAANLVRVILLVVLVVWRGEGILQTFLHPLLGMMTFALALPLILWLGGPASPRRTR